MTGAARASAGERPTRGRADPAGPDHSKVPGVVAASVLSLAIGAVAFGAECSVEGTGFRIREFREGAVAFGNRSYVLRNIPARFRGWKFTQLRGGVRSTLSVTAETDGAIYIATATSLPGIDLEGWRRVEGVGFHYTDKGRTALVVFARGYKAGSKLRVPQGNWTGAMVIAPMLSGHAARPDSSNVPGVVIDHSPAVSGQYIGSPSIAVLPGGDYVASHDFFGPGTKYNEMAVFGSEDGGKSWKQLSRFKGQWWSTLFVHRGALYLIGTSKEYGHVVIRRSEDGGRTWTEPKDGKTGRIRDDARYHCAPVPMLAHGGRIWRAFELVEGKRPRWAALVFSAPVDADLLDAESWRMSEPLTHLWSRSQWIEGNIVHAPEGKLVNILRTNGQGGDKAAIVHVSADGRGLSHDRTKDIIDFPGGGAKFTIRHDGKTSRYWSIGSKQTNPKAYRNTLVLTSSRDLRSWKVEKVLLHHTDSRRHAWQYIDWLFEGDDIIFVSRTAWDGAHSAHDANYLTFHRIRDFRNMTMKDSAPGALAGTKALAKETRTVTNSIGMELIEIRPGSFMMGQDKGGDRDERPVHKVTITRRFLMSATEVTNAQYERFDPQHRKLRGKRGLSKEEDEAVIFVSWHDAVRFCEWLSKKEGKPYRLPTEAEWEYAARAGTTTAFHTGDGLPKAYHKQQRFGWHPRPVSLAVGRTPPNAFGLHGMHGNVEEWCHDWYGPYEAAGQVDPVGRATGLFKVTRGGSHNTDVEFLRSAGRLGTLAEDRHWLIGFRVVQAELPATEPLPPAPAPAAMTGVGRTEFDWSHGPDMREPFFEGPIRFVRKPARGSSVPFYRHNHCPSITWCPNGDLLAVWFSTETERGREMTILASRLRAGRSEWDEPSEFFKAPDRNMTGSSLFHDGKGTIHHANGLEAAGGWANLALVVRTSTDNGATWSAPRLAGDEHQPRNQVIDGMSMTKEGWLIQPCDAVHGGSGGTAIHVSRDGGMTWIDPGAGTPKPNFKQDKTGGTIAGIHAGVVQLRDGRLLAFGRGDNRLGSDDNIGERMPMSVSRDMGQSWQYGASEFPPISGGQRLVLMRLRVAPSSSVRPNIRHGREGPIMFVSFTDASKARKKEGMLFPVAPGKRHRGFGMFAALSFDEGGTWPVKKLITGGERRRLDGGAWTRSFTMDATNAEPKGYLAATQTPDGVIHLISSALHYRFNVAWLKQPAPAGRR